jgi:hypothetical protein
MKPVSLRAVVDEMDILSDSMTSYINTKTGELFTVGEEEMNIVEQGTEDDKFIPEWQKDILPKVREVLESEDFIALPDKFEIHEYSIMERFCLSISDDTTQDELLHAIRGSGAFRRFRDEIYRMDIEDDWYRFRGQALKRIAVDFLEGEGIEFVDDLANESG